VAEYVAVCLSKTSIHHGLFVLPPSWCCDKTTGCTSHAAGGVVGFGAGNIAIGSSAKGLEEGRMQVEVVGSYQEALGCAWQSPEALQGIEVMVAMASYNDKESCDSPSAGLSEVWDDSDLEVGIDVLRSRGRACNEDDSSCDEPELECDPYDFEVVDCELPMDTEEGTVNDCGLHSPQSVISELAPTHCMLNSEAQLSARQWLQPLRHVFQRAG
jgi:hypothetical protein